MFDEENNPQDSAYKKTANIVVEVDDRDTLAQYGLRSGTDGLVNWQRNCKTHPRNWSKRRKTFDTTVIILFELYT